MRPAIFLSLVFYFVGSSVAQITKMPSRDSLKKNIVVPAAGSRKIPAAIQTIEQEIYDRLNILLDKFTSKPNTVVTWARVRNEATDLLLQYYLSGKLLGSTSRDAFYVKMDATTMTANDIAGNRMILICGAAINKPAEFIIFRVEKKSGQ